MINDYFGQGQYSNLILLVEKSIGNLGPVEMTINRFQTLADSLIGFAVILRDQLVEHVLLENSKWELP